MKYLGLDVGARRIGVAVGDSELRIATPVRVVERRTLNADAQALAALAREYEAEVLVVGLPRAEQDESNAQAEIITKYARALRRLLGLPLEFWDETLSTVIAQTARYETGARGKKARRGIDAAAAAVMLQSFLDGRS
jgi:putative Holliday junction resolvase